jgi:hypothetical protein
MENKIQNMKTIFGKSFSKKDSLPKTKDGLRPRHQPARIETQPSIQYTIQSHTKDYQSSSTTLTHTPNTKNITEKPSQKDTPPSYPSSLETGKNLKNMD